MVRKKALTAIVVVLSLTLVTPTAVASPHNSSVPDTPDADIKCESTGDALLDGPGDYTLSDYATCKKQDVVQWGIHQVEDTIEGLHAQKKWWKQFQKETIDPLLEDLQNPIDSLTAEKRGTEKNSPVAKSPYRGNV